MTLLTALIFKNSRILAGIYFIFLKKRSRSYQVRQELPHFCNLVALSLA